MPHATPQGGRRRPALPGYGVVFGWSLLVSGSVLPICVLAGADSDDFTWRGLLDFIYSGLPVFAIMAVGAILAWPSFGKRRASKS